MWDIGSIFLIPLKDGSSCPGQVVGRERDVLNSATVAIFDSRGAWEASGTMPALNEEDIFSKLFVSKHSLDSGHWKVIGKGDVVIEKSQFPNESARMSGFVGAKVNGSDIVDEFVNAYYGLVAWDDWYVPDFLDDLLVSPEKKPVHRLTYSGRHPR